MELTESEKQVTEDTRELLVTSDEKQKELTEYQTNVVNIKNMHQTYLQTLLAVKHEFHLLFQFVYFQLT
jgi:hypothetical protein